MRAAARPPGARRHEHRIIDLGDELEQRLHGVTAVEHPGRGVDAVVAEHGGKASTCSRSTSSSIVSAGQADVAMTSTTQGRPPLKVPCHESITRSAAPLSWERSMQATSVVDDRGTGSGTAGPMSNTG